MWLNFQFYVIIFLPVVEMLYRCCICICVSGDGVQMLILFYPFAPSLIAFQLQATNQCVVYKLYNLSHRWWPTSSAELPLKIVNSPLSVLNLNFLANNRPVINKFSPAIKQHCPTCISKEGKMWIVVATPFITAIATILAYWHMYWNCHMALQYTMLCIAISSVTRKVIQLRFFGIWVEWSGVVEWIPKPKRVVWRVFCCCCCCCTIQ